MSDQMLTDADLLAASAVVDAMARAGFDLRGYEHLLVPRVFVPVPGLPDIGINPRAGELWMKISEVWTRLGMVTSLTHDVERQMVDVRMLGGREMEMVCLQQRTMSITLRDVGKAVNLDIRMGFHDFALIVQGTRLTGKIGVRDVRLDGYFGFMETSIDFVFSGDITTELLPA